MTRSEAAEKLNDVINLYADYIDTGIAKEHADYDFSYYDREPESFELRVPDEGKKFEAESVNRTDFNVTVDSASKDAGSVSAGKSKTSLMIDLSMEISKCKLCPLSAKTRNIIPGRGLVNTKIFIIANPLSVNEEKENYPISGEERNFFIKWMNAIDIDIDKVFITNLLKCNWKTAPLKIEYIESCRKHLDRQIDIVKPQIILTLGQLALSSIRKSPADIMNEHGKIIDYRGYKIFPIFDPAMVLKDQSLKAVVWKDLKIFKSIADSV